MIPTYITNKICLCLTVNQFYYLILKFVRFVYFIIMVLSVEKIKNCLNFNNNSDINILNVEYNNYKVLYNMMQRLIDII